MIPQQLDLFEKKTTQREWWTICWNWDGPEIGKMCELESNAVEYADGSGRESHYRAPCKIIDQLPGGKWLGEIDWFAYGNIIPSLKFYNGRRVILTDDDIWPPVRELQELEEGRAP